MIGKSFSEQTYRVRGNRVIQTFERTCAEECVEVCDTRGFGIDKETCTFCCNKTEGYGCNNGSSTAHRITWNTVGLGMAAVYAYKSSMDLWF